MKTIIVTAFLPFGRYPANSSEKLARAIKGCWLSGYHVNIEVFPATIPGYSRAESVLERAVALDAHGIISLGMASGKKGLCIEAQTVNRIESAQYCPPELDRTPID